MGRKAFECSKWGDEKEPVAVYNLIVEKRTISCNCYGRGECKHKELVRTIMSSGIENELEHHTWSYDDGWKYTNDILV